MSNEPPLLHKYRDLSGDGLTRVRQSLITKSLWFSNPADFNDPFDCAPVVDTTWDKQGVSNLAKRVAERKTRGMSRFNKRKETRRIMGMPRRLDLITRDEAQAHAEKTMSDVRNLMGVLSLSADPINVLMWSHYARSHTGIVLSFHTNRNDIISEAQAVIYDPMRPVVDIVGDRENSMVKTLLHKADYWSYEQEWRSVRTGKAGAHPFDASSLAAIVFGAFTPIEHQQAIRQAAAIGGLTPKFGMARLNDRAFRMEVDDIS